MGVAESGQAPGRKESESKSWKQTGLAPDPAEELPEILGVQPCEQWEW